MAFADDSAEDVLFPLVVWSCADLGCWCARCDWRCGSSCGSLSYCERVTEECCIQDRDLAWDVRADSWERND